MAGRLIPLADKSGPLKREEVTCPICWSILIEPVTLPCKHILCLDCFKKHVQETSLQCPCCRMRLSVWSRRAFRENNLVDQKLWDRIQKEFPRLVDARLCGEDSQNLTPSDLISVDDIRNSENQAGDSQSLNNDCQGSRTFDGEISTNKGEIKRELEDLIRKHQEDIENQRLVEERASADLIRQLKEAGELNAVVDPAVVDSDLQLARKIDEEEKKVRLAEITSKRKLFTQPGSSECKSLPLESPTTKGKLISQWTTPKSSTSATHCKSPGNSSSNIDNCVTETPKNRGKRPSRSTLSSRSKKLKKGSVSSSRFIKNPFSSQKANSQPRSPSSQNSILNYLSNSQTLNDHLSQPPGSPEPCTSASDRSVEQFLNPFCNKYMSKNPHAPATATSPDSDVDDTSSISAFSPTKAAQSKVVPGAVYPSNSVNNPWSQWIVGEKSQLCEDPFRDTREEGFKSCERDTPTPNSIDLEISSHFRPIRSAPKTPPKLLPDGKVSNPVIVKTTPRKLNPISTHITSGSSLNSAFNPTSIDAKPTKISSLVENGKRISDDSGRASVSSLGSTSIGTLSDSDSSGCVLKLQNDHFTRCKSSLTRKLTDDVPKRVSPPTLTPMQLRPRPASALRSENSSFGSFSPGLPEISLYEPSTYSSPSVSSVHATAAGETNRETQENGEKNREDDPNDLAWLLNIDQYEPGSPTSQDSSIINLEDRRRQEEEFERLRLKKLQEEEDRKFAEKLQKQMNKKGSTTTRENPYGLRSWLRKSTSSNPNTP